MAKAVKEGLLNARLKVLTKLVEELKHKVVE